MGSDEYASVGGGGLRLKGSKVNKKKKKRDKSAKSHLEKNLGTDLVKADDKAKPERDNEEERQDDDEAPVDTRTETERRHHELKRKRLLELADSKGGRPELLKTHKERVEELNTYLSRLSEHHDMPRIGPG